MEVVQEENKIGKDDVTEVKEKKIVRYQVDRNGVVSVIERD